MASHTLCRNKRGFLSTEWENKIIPTEDYDEKIVYYCSRNDGSIVDIRAGSFG